MISPGKYEEAKLIDSRLDSDKDGNPKPTLVFSVMGADGSEHTVEWSGSLKSEKAEQMAYKTLLTAGWATADLKDLNNFQLAFVPKDLEIDVEHSEKYGTRVQWVNARRKAKAFDGKVETNAALVARLRSEMGLKPAANKADDIPF